MFAQSAPLVRPDRIASDLGMSERWVRAQAKADMPHHKFGAFLRFDPAAVREWIVAHRRGAEIAVNPPVAGIASPWLPLVKIPAFAEQVAMSERWAREQLKLGLPHFKFGTYVRIDPLEARSWLTERYHHPRPVAPDE